MSLSTAMSLAHILDSSNWIAPPDISGPDVHSRATVDLASFEGPLPAVASSMAPRRMRELAAGRRCAAQALRDAGSPELEVGVGAHREPRWPAGFVGSITHSASFAWAAVARAARVRALGIDSEPVFDEAAMLEAAPLALTPEEYEECSAMGGPHARERATLVFSAKESLYKCLYPLVGTFVDCLEARVISPSSDGAGCGTFSVRLLRDLAPGFGRHTRFEGRFVMARGHVHTAIEVRP